jgi:hypothetical protein
MSSQSAFSHPHTGAQSPRDAAGRDRIDESSAESFPASDPPAWAAAGCEPPPGPALDRRSALLRAASGHRVALAYDGGARITGCVLSCRPTRGPVDIVSLADAEVIASDAVPLERHERLVVAVASLVQVDLEELH